MTPLEEAKRERLNPFITRRRQHLNDLLRQSEIIEANILRLREFFRSKTDLLEKQRVEIFDALQRSNEATKYDELVLGPNPNIYILTDFTAEYIRLIGDIQRERIKE